MTLDSVDDNPGLYTSEGRKEKASLTGGPPVVAAISAKSTVVILADAAALCASDTTSI